jgi:hypothetical protein
MRTIHALALVILALLFSLDFACAQSPSHPKTNWELRGQGWLTNYYGRTLSSLGEIVSVKIEPASKATTPLTNGTVLLKIDPADKASMASTNRTHTAVWTVIEHSKLQDYYSRSVALHIPPVFTVEYADGTRVRATRHTASIRWPDGREGLFVLTEGSANIIKECS